MDIAQRDLPRDLRSLTGMRFVASFVVLLVHALIIAANKDPSLWSLTAVTSLLALRAVGFFFVLSGFILTWTRAGQPGDTTARFWRRRLVRVYPNHVATWAMMILIGSYVQDELSSPGSIQSGPAIANLFLVHVWAPDPKYINSVNIVTWSLACEAFFYLAFPLLYAFTQRLTGESLRRWTLLTFLVTLLIPCLVLLVPGGPPFNSAIPVPVGQVWLGYALPLCRLPEFVLGMLVAHIVRAGGSVRIRPYQAVALLVAATLLSGVLPPVFSMGPFLAAPCAVLIGVMASRDVRRARSVMSSRVVVYLGKCSYALYMVHYPVILFCYHAAIAPGKPLDNLPGGVVVMFVLVPVSVLASIVLYHIVELPFMRWFANPAAPRVSGAAAG